MTRSDEFKAFIRNKYVSMTFNLGTIMNMDRTDTLNFLSVHDQNLWPPRVGLIHLLRQYALDIPQPKEE